MRLLISIVFIAIQFLSPAWSAAPPAEAFGSLPGIYDAAISPDGKKVGVIRNIDGKYFVLVTELGSSKQAPRAIGLGEGVKPRSIIWANNDRILVSLWQSEKYAGTPITLGYLFSLDTVKMEGKILIKPPRNVLRQFNNIVVDYLEDDPDHILMAFSDDDNNLEPEIKRVNVESGRSFTVAPGMDGVQYWHTDLRGEPRVGQGLKDKSTEEWVLRIREADGKIWNYAKDFPGLEADASIYGFTSDPNELIIGSYQGKNTIGLYVYHLTEKRITRKIFHNDTYDAGGVILSQNGTNIVGATYVADTTEVVLFDEYSSRLDEMRKRYPAYTVDYIDQSKDGEKLIIKVSSPYDPGAVMVYDAVRDSLTRLGVLYEGLSTPEMGDVIRVTYTARDGAKIPAYVTMPPSITETSMIKNLPFIILPHGGPYARDEKRFDYLAQFFATRGYGVLQMNFRGSAGYGKSFEDSGRENWVVMQEDVEDGARWLIEKNYADPERMCIAGWSYGGYAALMGALKTPELYACAISMAGVTDLPDMISDIKKYRFGKISAQNFILRGFENRDDIRANSPVKLAGDLNVPLLLAHGTADQRVHFDQFKRLRFALKRTDADVTYLVFEEEDHFLSKQKNRVEFMQALEDFLKAKVGPSEFMK